LDYGLWKERFAGDPAIVGKSILLNGKPQTVVGVAPQNFNWFIKDSSLTGAKPRIWSPFVFPQSFHDHKQIGRFLTVVARLKQGVTHSQAQAEMSAIGFSRWRIARQLLMESLLLALIGGGVGVTLTFVGTYELFAASRRILLVLTSVSFCLRHLSFASGSTLVSSLLFGFQPSYRS